MKLDTPQARILPAACSAQAALADAGNGICAAGDKRTESAPETLSACGDRKAVRKNPQKMAAKAAFSVAGCEVLVSVDWVVGEPGLEPGTHRLRVRNNVVVEMGLCRCARGRQGQVAPRWPLATLDRRCLYEDRKGF